VSVDCLRRHQEILSAVGISLVLHYGLLIFAGRSRPEVSPEPAPRRAISLVLRHIHSQAPASRQDTPSPVAPTPNSAKPIAQSPRSAARAQPSALDPRGLVDIGLAGYLPAETLSVRPQFAQEVADFLPAAGAALVHGTVTFTIYLSEQGFIDRIDTDAPPEMRDVATRIEAMIRALPIQPGEFEGHRVKSRWVLEFSAEPVPFTTPQSSPSMPNS